MRIYYIYLLLFPFCRLVPVFYEFGELESVWVADEQLFQLMLFQLGTVIFDELSVELVGENVGFCFQGLFDLFLFFVPL